MASHVNGWKVGKSVVSWELALPYSNARLRCLTSPALSLYADIILDDAWADDAEHLRWVNTAKVEEIVTWAQTIKDGT
jgi:hypothetical protein